MDDGEKVIPTITAQHVAPVAPDSWPPPWLVDIRRDPPTADGQQEATALMPEQPEPAGAAAVAARQIQTVSVLDSLARHPGRWLTDGAWESLDNPINWDSFPPPPPPQGTTA
jgi:hypothetical protein